MRGVSWRRFPRIAFETARGWNQAATYLVASWLPRAVSAFAPSEKPHLLILARRLPPDINGGVYRPLALIEEAARRGWEVTAVSESWMGDPSVAGLELQRRYPPSTRIVHWEPPDSDVSAHFSPDVDGGFISVAAMIHAARAALGGRKPSLVLATGPAFAEFIGAMVLGTSWRVPYALDYRDEWSECPFEFVHKGRSNRFWESRTLAGAALVTFTTDSQRNHQMDRFPVLSRDRTAVILNGWDDLASASGQPRSPVGTRGVPVLSFLGNLSSYSSFPAFLVTLNDALAIRPDLVNGLELVFVGMKARAERTALRTFPAPGLLRDVGHVPLSEAQAMMRLCDALLLFNSPGHTRYIAGKTFEYMATGRPILIYGEGGETERLLAGYGPATVVRRGDAAGLAAALGQIADRVPRPPVDPSFLEGTSRTARSRAHFDLLEGIITGARGTGAASPQPG